MATGPAEIVFGPILIGVFFNTILYGVMIMQYLTYIREFKKDRMATKLFVHGVFVLDTCNTAFNMAYVYIGLVQKFGNIPSLFQTNFFFGSDPILTGLLACVVQLFFAWRVQKLLSKPWVTAVIAACSIVQLLAAVGTTIGGNAVGDIRQFQKFKVAVIVWLSFAALADVLIAAILVVYLSRRRTGFSQTDEALSRISRLTMETGALTAIVAMVDLVLFLANPTALHLLFNYTLGKLYSNSLMASLNARASIREASHDLPSHSSGSQVGSHGQISSARKFQSGITVPPPVNYSTHRDLVGQAHELDVYGPGVKVTVEHDTK